MSLCLRIRFSISSPNGFLHNVIKKEAKKLNLEGTARFQSDKEILLIVCGKRDDVDSFVDVIHEKSSKHGIDNIELEPFLKNRDYRRAFRVIE